MTFGKIGARKMMHEWNNPYVTNGLIAMWDGQWNVEGGISQDSSSTVWKDIVGGIELEVNSNASLSWNSDGLVSSSAIAGRYAIQNTNVPDALCAQILLIAKSGTSYSFSNGPLVMNLNSLSNGRYSLCILNNGVYRDGAGDGTARTYATTSADLTSALANGLLVTMNYGGVKPKYADEFYIGNNVVSYTGTAWGGGISNLGVGGQSSWVACQGVTLARICLYSRNLTAAEIAANYAVDKRRFNLP